MTDDSKQPRLDQLERAVAQLALATAKVAGANQVQRALDLNEQRYADLLKVLAEYREKSENLGTAQAMSLAQAAAGADDPDQDAELLAEMEREAGERPPPA